MDEIAQVISDIDKYGSEWFDIDHLDDDSGPQKKFREKFDSIVDSGLVESWYEILMTALRKDSDMGKTDGMKKMIDALATISSISEACSIDHFYSRRFIIGESLIYILKDEQIINTGGLSSEIRIAAIRLSAFRFSYPESECLEDLESLKKILINDIEMIIEGEDSERMPPSDLSRNREFIMEAMDSLSWFGALPELCNLLQDQDSRLEDFMNLDFGHDGEQYPFQGGGDWRSWCEVELLTAAERSAMWQAVGFSGTDWCEPLEFPVIHYSLRDFLETSAIEFLKSFPVVPFGLGFFGIVCDEFDQAWKIAIDTMRRPEDPCE